LIQLLRLHRVLRTTTFVGVAPRDIQNRFQRSAVVLDRGPHFDFKRDFSAFANASSPSRDTIVMALRTELRAVRGELPTVAAPRHVNPRTAHSTTA
jgi:hypothetical protein